MLAHLMFFYFLCPFRFKVTDDALLHYEPFVFKLWDSDAFAAVFFDYSAIDDENDAVNKTGKNPAKIMV